jgi:hypothetical protein
MAGAGWDRDDTDLGLMPLLLRALSRLWLRKLLAIV